MNKLSFKKAGSICILSPISIDIYSNLMLGVVLMSLKGVQSAKLIRVGFYMETAFHFYVYENIIIHLQHQEVECCLILNNMMNEQKLINEMQDFFCNNDVGKTSVELLSSISTSKCKFSVIVSPYYSPFLKLITSDYHVRAIYGLAKEYWNHAWWNAFYNLILCYGNYTKKN